MMENSLEEKSITYMEKMGIYTVDTINRPIVISTGNKMVDITVVIA